MITSTSDGTLTAGQAYSLNCSLTGITDIVTYQWYEGLPSNGTQLTNSSQLQFSSLRASDAGLYTCQATVNSMHIEKTTIVTITRKCINALSCIQVYNNNIIITMLQVHLELYL